MEAQNQTPVQTATINHKATQSRVGVTPTTYACEDTFWRACSTMARAGSTFAATARSCDFRMANPSPCSSGLRTQQESHRQYYSRPLANSIALVLGHLRQCSYNIMLLLNWTATRFSTIPSKILSMCYHQPAARQQAIKYAKEKRPRR